MRKTGKTRGKSTDFPLRIPAIGDPSCEFYYVSSSVLEKSLYHNILGLVVSTATDTNFVPIPRPAPSCHPLRPDRIHSTGHSSTKTVPALNNPRSLVRTS